MSRFIKPNFTTDNVYVEFRFESSLRKYEPKPHKKVKGENLCNNCCAHHNLKKTITNSPVSRCNLHFSKGKGNQGQQKTVQNKSFGGMSQIHLVSSNKSIKLSKKKVLQDLNSNNNELQMKIYASLVNIERQDNKNGKEEEQVFLNDFQPSVDMDREEEGEGDADFGKIEIDENLGVKMEEKQYQKQPAQYSQENNLQNNEMNAFEHIQEAISHMEQHQIEKTYENEQVIDEDNISLRIENMKVAEEIQEIQQQKPSQCLWIPNEQIAVIMEQKQESHLIKQQLSPRSEKSEKSEQKHSQFQKEQQNPFIRDRPEQDSIISSKLIDQNQMSESMMQKCLAFQGGRIYIDSSGQNFYISVRVFNKLRKNYSKLEDLITTLINQRPYLQGKRQKLRDEFEQYLRNQA